MKIQLPVIIVTFFFWSKVGVPLNFDMALLQFIFNNADRLRQKFDIIIRPFILAYACKVNPHEQSLFI